MENFLTVPEELYLLALNESEGNVQVTHYRSFKVALSGAILMNLALENRIDSDMHNIILDKKEAVGDQLLDSAFNELRLSGDDQKSIKYWIDTLASRTEIYNSILLQSLIQKGVLKIEDKKILWVFSAQKYPVVGDKEIEAVHSRVRNLIFSDEIPEVYDIVLISLLFNSAMLDLVLSDQEIDKHIYRIEKIAKMDMIGQSIGKSIEETVVSQLISEFSKLVKGGKSAEEKIQETADEAMKKYRLKSTDELPDWLKKGTDQYKKTVAFVEKTGTADIIYNTRSDRYIVKRYVAIGPAFSGEI